MARFMERLALDMVAEPDIQLDRSQQWTLDMLGNWGTFEFAPDSGGSNWDSEDRDHNDANELIERDGALDLTYDRNGNLLTQVILVGTPPFQGQQTITYTWDAWNRLVKVKYGSNERAVYKYNGLNWRVRKDADTSMPPDGTLNQRRTMYYSANWQLLEERIVDDLQISSSIDRHMQYVWGLRYIDDIVLRRQSSDLENDDPDVTYEDVWYHCTDALYSTVAIVDESAVLIERVSYDAYGRARHHRRADLDGDGATTTADSNILSANSGNYGVGDLNRNGRVGSADATILNNDLGAALSSGQLSSTDNIIGYAGYVFNAEMHGGGLYTVRHRHYSPDLGRWMSRDPLGYVDGMGLYEYVRSGAIGNYDPFGLFSDYEYIPTYGPNDIWLIPKPSPNPSVPGAPVLTPLENLDPPKDLDTGWKVVCWQYYGLRHCEILQGGCSNSKAKDKWFCTEHPIHFDDSNCDRSLPGGKRCCDATMADVEACLKSREGWSVRDSYGPTDNCQTWSADAVKDCCGITSWGGPGVWCLYPNWKSRCVEWYDPAEAGCKRFERQPWYSPDLCK